MKPTIEFYSFFQFLYDHFNKELFQGELPNCMIVITRKNNTFGYYCKERWENADNTRTDEIAINPMYFSKYPLIEILQTLCHEMCHLWQEHLGTPSQRTYHNTEWGNKMTAIGLMPSNTGKVGGKKTGQQMMEYPIEDGIFIECCKELIKNSLFKKMWYDRSSSKIELSDYEIMISNLPQEDSEVLYSRYELETPAVRENQGDNSKGKYTCPECNINIWGKKDLNVICGECSVALVMQIN